MVLNMPLKNENPNICGTGGYRVKGLVSCQLLIERIQLKQWTAKTYCRTLLLLLLGFMQIINIAYLSSVERCIL